MNPLTVFFTAVLDGLALVALVAVPLAVLNRRDLVAWARRRWHQFSDLPASTSVDRMLREVEQRERGASR